MTRNFAAPAALFTMGICAMALAACSDSAEETSEPQPEAELITPQDDQVPYAATNPPALPTSFPAAIQGRWGLVPADCTSTKGDAKGLERRNLKVMDPTRKLARLEFKGVEATLLDEEVLGVVSASGRGEPVVHQHHRRP